MLKFLLLFFFIICQLLRCRRHLHCFAFCPRRLGRRRRRRRRCRRCRRRRRRRCRRRRCRRRRCATCLG